MCFDNYESREAHVTLPISLPINQSRNQLDLKKFKYAEVVCKQSNEPLRKDFLYFIFFEF